MSTIDIGASERPLSRIYSPRAVPSPASTPAVQTIDTGDFYIGSVKINTLPPLNTAGMTPAN